MKPIFLEKPITPAQIEAWKKEHLHVYKITVKADGGDVSGYFRRMTLDEIGISSQAKDSSAFKVGVVLYNTCLLGGHPSFGNDDEVKLGAMKKLNAVLKEREATIEKL